MNFKYKKWIATVTCMAVLAGAATIGASAAKSTVTANQPKAEETKPQVTQTAADEEKDETVYVFAAADGSVEKVVASDRLKTADGVAYTKKTADETLPVLMHVTYTLDGQKIAPKDLAGKSGLLTVRYEFENKQSAAVKVDGVEKSVKVPFAVLTGIILDNEVFSNVDVVGGRLIDDGDRSLVVGVTVPGLSENLDVSKDKLDLPEYVQITAQVRDFKMMNTMTFVTNEFFRELDVDKLNDLDELTNAVDKLSDAMKQLIDGSGKLESGLATLQEKSGQLAGGATQLADGAGKLAGGAAALDQGVDSLVGGAGQLSSGLTTLSQNSAALNAGAGQVFDLLLGEANNQLAASGLSLPGLTRDNYAQVLNGAIDSLGEGPVRQQAEAVAREKVTAAVNGNKDAITAAVTAGVQQKVEEEAPKKVREGVFAQVLASQQLKPEDYEQLPDEVKAQINAAVDAQMETEPVKAMIAQAVQAAMASEETQNMIAQMTQQKIEEIIEQKMNSPEVQDQITAALQQANAGAAAISALKGQLDSFNQFYQGVVTYTAGVDSAAGGAAKLAAGAGELKKGSAALRSGSADLSAGAAALKNNVPALIDGVTQLHNGSKALSEGINQFNREGIQKLVDAVDGDLDQLVSKLRASVDAAGTYTGFAETSGPDDCVKFIFRTSAIE